MLIGIYQMKDGFTFIGEQEKSFKSFLYAPFMMARNIALFSTGDILDKSNEQIVEMYFNPETNHNDWGINPDNVAGERFIEIDGELEERLRKARISDE